MEKIKINLKNCYGIQELEQEFVFSDKATYAIYAPNGTMKTSFALSLKDYSEGKNPKDRIYTSRKTVCDVQDCSKNSKLDPNNIFVVGPYDQDYKSEKISRLLASETLKSRYDSLHAKIDEEKEKLIDSLNKQSGLRQNTEETIIKDIGKYSDNFLETIKYLRDQDKAALDSNLADIKYNDLFNVKVLNLLEEKDLLDKLNDYIENYEKLLSTSDFFKKGVFNHNNADEIVKQLDSNGYFKAKHSINVKISGQEKKINSSTKLEETIINEKKRILSNKKLAKSFEQLDKSLKKNKDVKEFRDLIEKNRFLIPELRDIPALKEKFWRVCLDGCNDVCDELLSTYDDSKDKLEEIIQDAKNEKTKWEYIINIFNQRFIVPFKVGISNQEDVILKRQTPIITFSFEENKNETPIYVKEKELFSILSNGEKRALYLLNIIFEIEARKSNGQKTLLVFDDIADSFDYKNKYAIIEYLNDISKNPNFSQIILTHNFDFYRTVSSRLDMSPEQKLHTEKNVNKIILKKEKYQKNPFKYWKNNLHKNDEVLISSIPFIRNLAEYCGHKQEYTKLTSMLHIKEDSNLITIQTLENIIKKILVDKSSIVLNVPPNLKIIEHIYNKANAISEEKLDDMDMDLEKKVILSVAIRLKAEEYMQSLMSDDEDKYHKKNQTFELFELYKRKNPNKSSKIKLLERVLLMTPENIHLNSFMYEPIIDMSPDSLISLYKEIKESDTKN